jgi:hypothetical protein
MIHQVIRKRRGQRPVSDAEATDFDLISSLLPSSSSSSAGDEEDEEDSETDDILRETTLLLLRLTYAQAHTQLENMDQELELLRSAPPPPPSWEPPVDDQRGKNREVDDVWKLDAPARPSGSRELLDPNGKVRLQLICPIFGTFF